VGKKGNFQGKFFLENSLIFCLRFEEYAVSGKKGHGF